MNLTEDDWKYIFLSLDLSRKVFRSNPVLQDILDEDRYLFIEALSEIMDKIGVEGKVAFQKFQEINSDK
jgi:hypothetical protein